MNTRHFRNIRGFLSDYFLGSVFDARRSAGHSGLSDRDLQRSFRRALYLRQNALSRDFKDKAEVRERFVRPILLETLGFHLGVTENDVSGLWLTPGDEAGGKPPLALCLIVASDDDFETRGPPQSLEKELSRRKVEHGFLLGTDRVRLIRAPGNGPAGAGLEADLGGLCDEEDFESFEALLGLFHSSRYSGEPGTTGIDEIELQSRKHAERVSEDLKESVFTAAEILGRSLTEDESVRDLLGGGDPDESFVRRCKDAALTGLYRLLFILYAEARDKRLAGHGLYRNSYSIEGLVEILFKKGLASFAANRTSYWERLRALFRIYDSGLPAAGPWENIPPRGGDFFKSDTPEGRILDAARISDAVTAEILLKLSVTGPRKGVGRERISFRELDIESLGAVYEGLLEYEPRISRTTMLEVSCLGREYVLTPEETARLCREKDLRLQGPSDLTDLMPEDLRPVQTDASEHQDRKDDEDEEGDDDSGDADAESAGKGLKKGAPLSLLRKIGKGRFYFVPGVSRKGSGSFYTPRVLVADLVRHTLGSLVKDRTSAEIEALKVCDCTCGSAHFLVEAMRFLGRELHAAYVRENSGRKPELFIKGEWDDNWKAGDDEARAANSEARAWCKRRIAERCLFGVDLNPTAVNLARVALWVESLAGDRPLTFFEHHIRCGNSLVGSWLKSIGEPVLPEYGDKKKVEESGSLFESQSDDLFSGRLKEQILFAARKRLDIDAIGPDSAFRRESVEEIEVKEHLLKEAGKTLESARLIFDLRSASLFLPDIWREWPAILKHGSDASRLKAFVEKRPWAVKFQEIIRKERFFHWELEFPELFMSVEKPGFDVILGNPPWDKIKPDKREFYGEYDVLIRAYVGSELDKRIKELEKEHHKLTDGWKDYEDRIKKLVSYFKTGGEYKCQEWKLEDEGKKTGGDPDLFKYVTERAWRILRKDGYAGLVLPGSLYNNEGCTGLRRMLFDECSIERFFAFENRAKLFPIDSRYKFVNLAFRKSKNPEGRFQASFMRHDPEELNLSGKQAWVLDLDRKEIEQLSPGTLSFPEFRDQNDRDIITKVYSGTQLLKDFDIEFYSEYHMTADKIELVHRLVENRFSDFHSDITQPPPIRQLFRIFVSDPSA